ncbi:MAG TPA: hypothetical protein DCY91_17350 [Cyanobacteria bacterium UBA11370]|nr:hypothetical protein [Cyanobacteria bacterium UBA11370]
MSEIIPEKSQFQIIVNSHTGRTIGRIYFSKVYICQHREVLKTWLKKKTIYFTQKDVKLYTDGSFRLYFEAPQSEYEILNRAISPYPLLQGSANALDK